MSQESHLLSAAVLGYGTSSSSPADAKKETFWDMLKYVFCPLFTCASFIFWVTVLDLALYVPLVVIDFDSHRFLEPTPQSLDWMGAKNCYELQHGQVWRWVTPMALHASIFHLVYNVVMQLIIGFRFEPAIGWLHAASIYVVSGCGGILLSAIALPNSLSAGASTAIFGITAALVALIIMRWDELEGGFTRILTLVWLLLLLIFNLAAGFGSGQTDFWGHLGGLVVGFALGCALFTSKRLAKWLLGAFLGVYFVGGFVLFYTVISADPINHED